MTIESPLFVLAIVYFVNLLLDYPLQSDFEAKWKSKSYYVLFVHSCIWGIGISLILVWLQGSVDTWKIPMLIIGHSIMDGFKARKLYLKREDRESNEVTKKDMLIYFIDQAFHVGQILIALYV